MLVNVSFPVAELTGKEVETGHILHALGHCPLLGVVLPRSRRSYTSDLLEGTRITWNENDRVTAWLLHQLVHQAGQGSLPYRLYPSLVLDIDTTSTSSRDYLANLQDDRSATCNSSRNRKNRIVAGLRGSIGRSRPTGLCL